MEPISSFIPEPFHYFQECIVITEWLAFPTGDLVLLLVLLVHLFLLPAPHMLATVQVETTTLLPRVEPPWLLPMLLHKLLVSAQEPARLGSLITFAPLLDHLMASSPFQEAKQQVLTGLLFHMIVKLCLNEH